MNRLLLIGYAANLVLILASILIARGNVPGLDKQASMVVSQLPIVLLLPAGIITLMGAIRSRGTLRRVLGYCLFGLDVMLFLAGILAMALLLFANATVI